MAPPLAATAPPPSLIAALELWSILVNTTQPGLHGTDHLKLGKQDA